MKARNEMNPEFMWDFTHMFADKTAWEAAYADCEADIRALSTLPGTLCASATALKEGLDKVYAAAKKMELVYLYAMLHQAGDNGDPVHQDMQGRAVNLIVAMNTAIAFLEPEILACDEETINAVKEELLKLNYFEEILITRAGGVISSHCGPNALGVLFYEKN